LNFSLVNIITISISINKEFKLCNFELCNYKTSNINKSRNKKSGTKALWNKFADLNAVPRPLKEDRVMRL
jgi:hypothetical protein